MEAGRTQRHTVAGEELAAHFQVGIFLLHLAAGRDALGFPEIVEAALAGRADAHAAVGHVAQRQVFAVETPGWLAVDGERGGGGAAGILAGYFAEGQQGESTFLSAEPGRGFHLAAELAGNVRDLRVVGVGADEGVQDEAFVADGGVERAVEGALGGPLAAEAGGQQLAEGALVAEQALGAGEEEPGVFGEQGAVGAVVVQGHGVLAAGQGEDVERVGDFAAGYRALAGQVVGVEVLVGLGFALFEAEGQVFQRLVEDGFIHREAGLLGFLQEMGGVGGGPPVVVVAARPVA